MRYKSKTGEPAARNSRPAARRDSDRSREEGDNWIFLTLGLQGTIQGISILLFACLAIKAVSRRVHNPRIVFFGADDVVLDLFPEAFPSLNVPAVQFHVDTGVL